ncbi:hypothetical protein ACJX0J_031069 [Zea mays]
MIRVLWSKSIPHILVLHSNEKWASGVPKMRVLHISFAFGVVYFIALLAFHPDRYHLSIFRGLRGQKNKIDIAISYNISDMILLVIFLKRASQATGMDQELAMEMGAINQTLVGIDLLPNLHFKEVIGKASSLNIIILLPLFFRLTCFYVKPNYFRNNSNYFGQQFKLFYNNLNYFKK